MAIPTDIVEDFCAMWEAPGGDDAIRKHFTADAIWENHGMVTTTGPDEAIALNAQFREKFGMSHMTFELLSIAADGNKVLTHRIDRMFASDGSEIGAFPVMGVFEIDADGKIAVWRDFFDTKGMMAPG